MTVISLIVVPVVKSTDAQPVRHTAPSKVARFDVPVSFPPATERVITPFKLIVFACCVPAPKPKTFNAELPGMKVPPPVRLRLPPTCKSASWPLPFIPAA